MHFKDCTIFVTGGAGFIGSAVVRHLLRDTHARVVNIDKLTYAASLESLSGADGNPHYAFEKQCICEGPALRKLFEKYQPDAVMNLEVGRRKSDPGLRRAPADHSHVLGLCGTRQQFSSYHESPCARAR